MEKTLIFLIGSAGSGKSTIGKRLVADHGLCYLDKDMLCNTLTGALLQAQGYGPEERDGNEYYQNVVRDLEYKTLLDVADDNLALGRSVLMDAPFGAYFSQPGYIAGLRTAYGWTDVRPLVLQVRVDPEVQKRRLMERGYDRDLWKFDHWEAFLERISKTRCLWEGVDLKTFDNSSDGVDAAALAALLDF